MARSTLFAHGRTVVSAAAAVTLLGLGCDKSTTTTPDADDTLTQTEDINDPFGGFNRSSEPAGFGDAFLLSSEGEAPADDEMADDPEVGTMLDRPDNDLYAVRITWGYLEKGEDASDLATDWTGTATIDDGAVIAVRTISFEPVQGDHIVRPRADRAVLDWASTTTVGFDGVQLLVVDPTDDGTVNNLLIDMPLVSESFDLASLADYDSGIVLAADETHQYRIQARKVELTADCRRGWLSGRWQNLRLSNDESNDLPDGVTGRFAGHWINRAGEVGGALRGYYGTNARGHRVMFGKLIDHEGNFRGLLRGTWAPGRSEGVGTFRAHWLSFDREVVGGMRGVWERRDRDGAGFFHGAWATSCGSDEAEEGDVDIDTSIFN